MSTSEDKSSGQTKPNSKLAALEKLKADALSSDDLFQNSVQSFDFSAIDWNKSGDMFQSTVVPSSSRNATALSASRHKHKHLLYKDNDFDDYDDGRGSGSDLSESNGKEAHASVLSSSADDDAQEATIPATHGEKDKSASITESASPSHTVSPVENGFAQPIDLDETPMDFFEDNFFKADISGSDGAAEGWAINSKEPLPVESSPPTAKPVSRKNPSNLRRPTMLPGDFHHTPTLGSAKGTIKPLEKPVTTRQQRQKSVGSALLVPGAKPISRQQRQRSMGAQPLKSSRNVTNSDNDYEEGSSTNFEPGGETKVRNPRLARKRQESFRGPISSDTAATGDNAVSTPAADVSHEKTETNRGNRGALSIFQRTRTKMNDDDEADGNKPGGAARLGAIIKQALTSGDMDEHTGTKSPAHQKRLNPRNFFNRHKHAFMESDEVSVSASSSGSDDESEAEQEGLEEQPDTAENKVLALIREKERTRGIEDVSSVPSFLSDDDESSELQRSASSNTPSGRSGSGVISVENHVHNPSKGTAENIVLAMIRAKEKETQSVDYSLHEELLEEDDIQDSPSPRQSATENKVLAMIKAKQRDTSAVDADLRAELLDEDGDSAPVRGENKVLALIKAREKEKGLERSKHSRSGTKSARPHKSEPAAAESSTHSRRAHRRDEERKTSGSHRSSHRSSAVTKSPVESSSHRLRSSRRQDDEEASGQAISDTGDKAMTPESSKHRRRSDRREEDANKIDEEKPRRRRSSRSKNEAPSTPKDEQDNTQHRRRSGGRSKHDTPSSSAAAVDDPALLARIKSRVKEGMSHSSHSRRSSEGSATTDQVARGVNRSLSSTDHRPSKGRVRKIRVSVSELTRVQSAREGSRSEHHSGRKGSGSGSETGDGRPSHSEGIESRRRRSRSTVDNKSPS